MKLKTLTLFMAAAGCLSAPVLAQTTEQRVQQLEAQVRQLVEQLNTLKAAQTKAPQGGAGWEAAVSDLRDQVEINHKESVVMGDLPGSFRVPGTDTSVKVYGFAELQGWRDSKSTTAYDFSTATAFQPLNGTPDAARTGNFKFGARTSRLGVEVSTPTKFGALGAKVEMDFATEAGTTLDSAADQANRQAWTNSYRPRLRHGYVTLGSWTFGQTWSTFMDLDTLPETLDFNGLPAAPFVRQPMIKYSHPMKDIGVFTMALENPVSMVTNGGSPLASNFDTRPDLILRFDKQHDWGQWNVRLLNTEYRLDDGAGLSARRSGTGFALGAMIKTVGDDFISLQYTDGNGLGRYNISFADMAVHDAATNRILFERARSLIMGYQAKFNAEWRANFAYALQKATANDFSAMVAGNREVAQAHLNVIYTPYKNMDMGLEYLWGNRKTFGGGSGTLSRLMGSVKYSF